MAPDDPLGGYVNERVAGSDGMGVVYEAREPELRRRVALKVIAPDLTADEAAHASAGCRRRRDRDGLVTTNPWLSGTAQPAR